MVNELCLDILGSSFTITTDAEETYLKKILKQYKAAVKNTQNISGIKDPLNVAILTGFMLCDELNKIKLQLADEKDAELTGNSITSWEEQEVEDRTLRLIAKLEHALNLFADDKNQ